MDLHTITLNLPENIYLRLQQTAKATQKSLDEVFLHALEVGSPPRWDDVPAEFQTELAALDRLDDSSLWRIARSQQTEIDMQKYQKLLDKNANGTITNKERELLTQLRHESDRFMLCKAHALALLRWRGYQIPPAEQL